MGKTNAHIRYKNSRGDIVPGVTTVLGVLNKPALVKWANNLGLQGIDSTKFVDEKASIGTLAHYLIMCHFEGVEPDVSDFTPNQIAQAKNSLLSFYQWEGLHSIRPVLVEAPLVSDEYGYGGTVDLYAEVDDKPTLIDFKTGKGIFPEMFYQLAAYNRLLDEKGYATKDALILRIGRNEREGFEDARAGDLSREWQIFLHCLGIYRLRK